MSNYEFYQIFFSFISGSLVGVIVDTIIKNYKNRIQPIVKQIYIKELYKTNSSLPFKVKLDMDNDLFQFENMFLAEIQVINKGRKDFEKFFFGITLNPTDKAVRIEAILKDRHHASKILTNVTPQNSKSEIDFHLEPFNRKDEYSFKIYIVAGNNTLNSKSIKFSSKHPINFIDSMYNRETIQQIASL